MIWFKNLKVSAKLLLGFLFVSCITLAVGFFGFSKLNQISELRDMLAEKKTPSILYMGRINSSINAMAVCERGLLNDDFTKRNIRKPQYDDYAALELSKDEIEIWNTFSESFENWTAKGKTFISLNKDKDKLLEQGIQFYNFLKTSDYFTGRRRYEL